MQKSEIIVYTDGASSGNPGPGGYGIVMEWVGKDYVKEFYEGFKHTTNNRMELMAVIEALKKIKTDNCKITFFSDSKYVVDAVKKRWIFNWYKKNFKGVKNSDLWMMFYDLYQKFDVRMEWVKGHSGNLKNERCDFLATNAIKSDALREDEIFIKNKLK